MTRPSLDLAPMFLSQISSEKGSKWFGGILGGIIVDLFRSFFTSFHPPFKTLKIK